MWKRVEMQIISQYYVLIESIAFIFWKFTGHILPKTIAVLEAQELASAEWLLHS